MMRDQENLAPPFVDRVAYRHQPRLDFAQRNEVLRLVNEDGATLGNDKVQNGIEANQAPLTVGQLVESELPARELRSQSADIFANRLNLRNVKPSRNERRLL